MPCILHLYFSIQIELLSVPSGNVKKILGPVTYVFNQPALCLNLVPSTKFRVNTGPSSSLSCVPTPLKSLMTDSLYTDADYSKNTMGRQVFS